MQLHRTLTLNVYATSYYLLITYKLPTNSNDIHLALVSSNITRI